MTSGVVSLTNTVLKFPYNPSAKLESVGLYTGVQLTRYTQEFNSHSCTHGLKENFQLAVVMSNIEFTSLQTMHAMALKAGHNCNERPTPIPPASSSAQTTDPNAMDLSAFQR
ncbi:uncharacterized protein VP01_5253g1, partial [Puccinia sorghi]